MASTLLKKIRQTQDLGSSFPGEFLPDGEKLKSNKTFTEWLLSPSLYPSDERILSTRLVARRSSDFKGCFYSLETSRATYTFFCPADGALKGNWPRLKALWSDFARRYPGRVQGVRFLRTVGELPIWLDDEAAQLRVDTSIKNRGEIACLVERRIINRVNINQLSERGIYSDELNALAELIDLQIPATLNYDHYSSRGPIVGQVSSELLPYEILIQEMSRGISFERSEIGCGDLELLTYDGGILAWGVKTETTREELLCCLRENFGVPLIEALSSLLTKKFSNLALSLIAYASNKQCQTGLRRAIKDLIVGPQLSNLALVVVDKEGHLASELADIFETKPISHLNDVEIECICPTYGAVPIVHLTETVAAISAVQKLKDHGLKVISLESGQEGYSSLFEISHQQGISDQVITVLRGISNVLN